MPDEEQERAILTGGISKTDFGNIEIGNNFIGDNIMYLLSVLGNISQDSSANTEELPNKFRTKIKNKLESQIGEKEAKGLLFYSNSGLANRIISDKTFKKFIKNNINNIPFYYNQGNEIKYSLEFNNGRNLPNAIGKADVINLKFDIFGNISGDLIDITDYNNEEYRKLAKAGNALQKENKIEPIYIIVHFVLHSKNIEEIIKNEQ